MNEQRQSRATGFGQLSLVEHSLCPLSHQSSLIENLVHQGEYRFSGAKGKRKTAKVRVFCPLGLSANDELYLWGVLALTLSQAGERCELVATPHWCLKELGIIDSAAGRGGEQYRLFRDALRRLSTVSYLSDAFYDPVRGEHREVSFHLFSYSLPTDESSQRAWRITWDPTFFELTKHRASHLRFDLDVYRSLDPASRRLFLFASKIFHRRATLPRFDLGHLAVDVLGFSPSVALRDLRMKVVRCLKRLDALDVVTDAEVTRLAQNRYVVTARRGKYFARGEHTRTESRQLQPVLDSLLSLGFELGAARGLLRKYPAYLLEEWADITQAKIERQGMKSFRRSPMAFFVDSVSKAHQGLRTPPDWWHEVRRSESEEESISNESRRVFDRIRDELFGGPSPDGKGSSQGMTRPVDVLKSTG